MKKILSVSTLLVLLTMAVAPPAQQAKGIKGTSPAALSGSESAKPVAGSDVLLILDPHAIASGQMRLEPAGALARCPTIKLAKFAAPQQRQPSNSADQNWPPDPPLADDNSPCDPGNIFTALLGECSYRIYSKLGSDYSSIGVQAAAGFAVVAIVGTFVPAVAPAAAYLSSATKGKLAGQIGKDTIYCVVATAIERSSASFQQKTENLAALNDVLEVADSLNDMRQLLTGGGKLLTAPGAAAKSVEKVRSAEKSAKKLRQFWNDYWFKNQDSVGSFLFSVKSVAEAAEVPGKAENARRGLFETPDDRSRRAVLDAENKAKECEFAEAAKLLDAAIKEGLEWFDKIRQSIVAKRKEVRCLRLRYAKDELEGLAKGKQDQIQYLRDLRTRQNEFREKEKELTAVKERLDKLQKGAEEALDSCDFRTAEAKIEQAKNFTLGWCGSKFSDKDDAYRAIQQRIEEEKAKTNDAEKRISELFSAAQPSGGRRPACSAVQSALDSIENIARENRCVNAFNATAKVTSLRNVLKRSEDAAKEALQALASGRAEIGNCNLEGARTAAARARQALANMQCLPSGIGVPSEADVQELESAIKAATEKVKELQDKVSELLSDADRAATNCDLTRVNSSAEQLNRLINENTVVCPSLKQEWQKRMNEIAEKAREALRKRAEAESAIREGDKASKQCDVQAIRAAAQKLSGMGAICGLNTRAEAERLNGTVSYIDSIENNVRASTEQVKAAADRCDLNGAELAMAEVNRIADAAQYRCQQLPVAVPALVQEASARVQSMKSYLASLEPNVKAASEAVKAATDNCDLRAAETAMAELNRIVDAAQYRCPQVPASVLAMVQESSGRVERLKANLNALVSNLRVATEAVKSAADSCDLRAAETAMAQVNRLADSVRCPQLPPEIPRMVQEAYTRFEQLKSRGGNAGAEIQSAYSTGEAALDACNLDTASQQFDRAIALFNNNRGCAGSFNIEAAINGAQQARTLKGLYNDLENSLTVAEKSCPPAPYEAMLGLRDAEKIIAQIRELNGACALGQASGRLARARNRIKKLDEASAKLYPKIKLAEGFLNDPAMNFSPSKATAGAEARIKQASKLLDEARELAGSDKCFQMNSSD